MTTFAPVRDAYQAWLKTSDQLTFDGALEDREEAEGRTRRANRTSGQTPSRSSSAPAHTSDPPNHNPVPSGPLRPRGGSGDQIPANDNGPIRKPDRASADGATGGSL